MLSKGWTSQTPTSKHLWRLHHGQNGWETIQWQEQTWLTNFWHAACRPHETNEPWSKVSHDKFSLLINDNCSGFGFVFNMCHKDETTRAIIELDKVIEMKFQKRVHTLWTDNGGEFVNQQLQTYCQNHGISLVTSVAYNPELNGRAERQNQTHIEGARTMLKDLQLGKDLWGEAISTHIYIRNRCPSSILPNNITPYEKILGQPPSVGHLQVFGSRCFIKIPDKN